MPIFLAERRVVLPGERREEEIEAYRGRERRRGTGDSPTSSSGGLRNKSI